MKATIKWLDGVRFLGQSGSGHSVIMDGPPDLGGQNAGVRPMEMLLLGMGSCAAFDVLTILKKSRQKITGCIVELDAKRANAVPAVFTDIHLHFKVMGHDLSSKHVERAVNLSAEKYCSASIMLQAAGVNITHDYAMMTTEISPESLTPVKGRPKPTSGLRHVALWVKNFDETLTFYTELLGMEIEWQPDEDNYYLSSGHDNLALHRFSGNNFAKQQHLDHIGFIIDEIEQVDSWHAFLKSQGVSIISQPSTHRDGARSFYCKDPDENTVQMIYHLPLSGKSQNHS